MSKGVLARKVGMTQLFTPAGTVVPVTVLDVAGCRVVQRKTAERDGYDAAQLGIDELPDRRARRMPKPLAGHFAKHGVKPMRHLAEVRDPGDVGEGTRVGVDLFHEGQLVHVTGTSQGKGFAGQHKRHNFKRGPVSHGSHNIKQPGSIGSVDAARTFRGLRMAGHMGAARRTVRNLEVVRVDADRNLILLKGNVPGHRNGIVLVRDADDEATY